jgi:hypothetical protein
MTTALIYSHSPPWLLVDLIKPQTDFVLQQGLAKRSTAFGAARPMA